MRVRYPIPCLLADLIRSHPDVRAFGGCTNYVSGEVLDYNLPPHTSTTFGIALKNGREVEVMYEQIGENGCRHWALEDDGEDQA